MDELIARLRALVDSEANDFGATPQTRGMHDILLAMEERASTLRTEMAPKRPWMWPDSGAHLWERGLMPDITASELVLLFASVRDHRDQPLRISEEDVLLSDGLIRVRVYQDSLSVSMLANLMTWVPGTKDLWVEHWQSGTSEDLVTGLSLVFVF